MPRAKRAAPSAPKTNVLTFPGTRLPQVKEPVNLNSPSKGIDLHALLYNAAKKDVRYLVVCNNSFVSDFKTDDIVFYDDAPGVPAPGKIVVAEIQGETYIFEYGKMPYIELAHVLGVVIGSMRLTPGRP